MNEFERRFRVFKNELKRWFSDNASSQKSSEKQRPNIKMCPTCGRFNEATATECEFCESLLQPKPQATVRADGTPAPPINPVMVVFAICAFVYLLSGMHAAAITDKGLLAAIWNPGGKALYSMGANMGYDPRFGYFVLETGQWWRTITYTFLHGGALHIFMNFSALSSLGPAIWECFGTRRFWLITLLTGLGGGLLSALAPLHFLSDTLSGGGVGFSGALFGYLGALYMYFQQQGSTTIADKFKKYMIWGNVVCILLTVSHIFPIDNYGHLGGMFTGMALVWAFQNKGFRNLGDNFERALIAGCVLLLAWGVWSIYVIIGQT